MNDNQYPTPEILEGILASLLNQHPDAAIAAVNADSRPVPMPASISLAGRPNGAYRHAFALVDPDDRVKVIEAWDRVLAEGASSTPVHLANVSRDAATLCFVDARRAHGVYLRFLALTGGDGSVAAADTVPVRPARSSSIHKNPMSFITAIDLATTSMLDWPAEEIIGRRSLDFIHRIHQIVGIDRKATLDEQSATVVPDDQQSVSGAFGAVLDLGVVSQRSPSASRGRSIRT